MTVKQERLLDDILAVDRGLTGREIDFLDDLDQNWRDRDLSERQDDWLQRIGERVL